MSVGDITPMSGDAFLIFSAQNCDVGDRVRVCKLRLEREGSIFSFNTSRPKF
jgi:hypothetical protein